MLDGGARNHLAVTLRKFDYSPLDVRDFVLSPRVCRGTRMSRHPWNDSNRGGSLRRADSVARHARPPLAVESLESRVMLYGDGGVGIRN
jgi:hypothetical protein